MFAASWEGLDCYKDYTISKVKTSDGIDISIDPSKVPANSSILKGEDYVTVNFLGGEVCTGPWKLTTDYEIDWSGYNGTGYTNLCSCQPGEAQEPIFVLPTSATGNSCEGIQLETGKGCCTWSEHGRPLDVNFVGWKLDGKIISTSPHQEVKLTKNSHYTALYKVGSTQPNCSVELEANSLGGGAVNAEVKLSGGASKSVTLSSSNNYKYIWSNLPCGKQYNVSAKAVLSPSADKNAWADAVLSASADPSSFTLNSKQKVRITITESAVQDCGIEVQGTGDTGNGVFANISLTGGANKTAVLDESNSYLATWTGLACGKSYTVSVTKAGEKKNGTVTSTKVTATVNPSGAFTITGQSNDVTKMVKVNLKKEAATCKVTMNKIINGVASSTPARGETVEVQCGTPMAVSVTMNTPAEDAVSKYEFKSWQVLKGEGNFANSSNRNTTFTPTTDSTISISTENVQGAIVYLKVTNAGGSQFDNASVFLGVGGTSSDPDSIFGGYVAVGETRIVNVPFKYEQYVIQEGNTCLPDGTCGLYSQNPGGLEYHSEKQYTYEAIIGYGHIEYDCEVEVTATTGGTVQPAGTFGTSCNAPFNIEARANSGYQFTGWTRVSGDGNFDDSKAALTSYMPFAGKSVIRANFEKANNCKVIFVVNPSNGGSTSPSGTRTVTCGESLTVSATPNSGYTFASWKITSGSGRWDSSVTGDVAGANSSASATFTPSTDVTLQANFDSPKVDLRADVALINCQGYTVNWYANPHNTETGERANFSGTTTLGMQDSSWSTYQIKQVTKGYYNVEDDFGATATKNGQTKNVRNYFSPSGGNFYVSNRNSTFSLEIDCSREISR